MPCQSVAYTTRGFPGSKQRSIAAVTLSLYRTFFQLRPPSVDRKTPRSSFGPVLCPIAATSLSHSPPAARRKIIDRRISRHARYGVHFPRAKRPDHPPLHL